MVLDRGTAGALLRLAGNLCLVVGALLLGAWGLYSGYALYAQYQAAHFPQNRGLALQGPEARRPHQELREEPPVFLPPAPGAALLIANRPPATRIRVPSIGVDSPIVELGTTWDEKGELVWETPKHAVGHHRGTANPGEVGNAVLSGHISSPIRKEGNVFARLPHLKLGEEVQLDAAEGTYTYRVVSRWVVEPTEVRVMDPAPIPLLTLITCYPDWVYSHRLVLTATLVDFTPFD